MQTRQAQIDALKLIASQLIVLHHFAAYGPLADALSEATPGLAAWLYDYARMAVQVFLVLGGYLAVQSLAPEGVLRAGVPWRLVAQRYKRLALPFVAAMAVAVIASLLARQWLVGDFIPAAPSWGQVLAHGFLLHGIMGVDALSAGVWYVAIDFQLFALLTCLLWLGRARPRFSMVMVLCLMLASLFLFNRDDGWDNWALYFFGAYGMGATALWAGRSYRPGGMLALLGGVGLMALAIDFRERIALALATALLLGLFQWRTQVLLGSGRIGMSVDWPAAVSRLGQSSYALFLMHFPVLMLGNAFFVRLGLSGAWPAGLVLLASWSASIGLGLLFERWVERPLSRLR